LTLSTASSYRRTGGNALVLPHDRKTQTHTHTAEDAEKIVVVNTDSKVTLDTLQNRNKHYILIGNKRK